MDVQKLPPMRHPSLILKTRGFGPSPILYINRKMSSTSHKHLRSMWNLYTDLLIRGKNNDAKIVREAINVAEQNELDAVGKY